MPLIDPASLSRTLDSLEATLRDNRKLTPATRKTAARWIASRQGLPGSYANTFALFPAEAAQGVRVFTGERMTSASARHIIGEEAMRMLHLLNVRDAAVQQALKTAHDSMFARIHADDQRLGKPAGSYCCTKCSVSVWRYLTVGGFDQQPKRLNVGLNWLRQHRKGDGTYRGFPFWYTTLALTDIAAADLVNVTDELRYLAPRCETFLQRKPTTDPHNQRRRHIAQSVLTHA